MNDHSLQKSLTDDLTFNVLGERVREMGSVVLVYVCEKGEGWGIRREEGKRMGVSL